MICPRCDSPEGSGTLSVPLCDPCLNDWWASGLSIPGPKLVEQPEMSAWLERPAEAPRAPRIERKPKATRRGMVGLVFRLPVSSLLRLKELSANTRIRQSEYLREAIADMLMKYEDDEGVQP